jgi:glycerophosphoryl diester phosphodiesterase
MKKFRQRQGGAASRGRSAVFKTVVAVLLGGSAALYAGEKAQTWFAPMIHASLHQDGDRAKPLFGALELGFRSLETDVHLVGDRLLVGHNPESLRPDRTLQALYFEPLRQRVKENGGRVYPHGPTFLLLLDYKTAGRETHAAVCKLLAQYADLLTAVENGKIREGAVTVIISGTGAGDESLVTGSPLYTALDGRIAKHLTSSLPVSVLPMISDSWGTHFAWRGQGPLPEGEKKKLLGIVSQAHQKGRLVRFWATPDQPRFWKELRAAGVDIINTDRPQELRKFLLEQEPPAGR